MNIIRPPLVVVVITYKNPLNVCNICIKVSIILKYSLGEQYLVNAGNRITFFQFFLRIAIVLSTGLSDLRSHGVKNLENEIYDLGLSIF